VTGVQSFALAISSNVQSIINEKQLASNGHSSDNGPLACGVTAARRKLESQFPIIIDTNRQQHNTLHITQFELRFQILFAQKVSCLFEVLKQATLHLCDRLSPVENNLPSSWKTPPLPFLNFAIFPRTLLRALRHVSSKTISSNSSSFRD
jgi:hypothetical protein